MFQRITFASRPGGFFMLGGVIFGSYSAETVSVIGSTFFIATDGASGDTYTKSASGD